MAGGKTWKPKRHCQNCHNAPYGKRSKRSYRGPKHHLTNHRVIGSVIEKAGIKPTDVVMEINPGLGTLTERLFGTALSVVAVEPDHAYARDLESRFKKHAIANRFQIIQGDACNCELPYFDICLANLPPRSFSPTIFKLLSRQSLFRCAIIMVQSEFAMKLTAQPNEINYCGLSATIQLLASLSHLTVIDKNNFSPPHKSNISLIRLEPKNPSPINLRQWFGFVKICFLGKKTKMLSTVFRQNSVLSLLEKNENKSLGDISGPRDLDIAAYIDALGDALGDLSMEGDDEDGEMMVESRDTKRSVFKGRVLNVLQEARLEEKKCYQLTQADLLSLLGLFNKAGIFFS